MTKYPTKLTVKPDSYGNYPSDEAWEKQQEMLARLNLKYGKQLSSQEKGA